MDLNKFIGGSFVLIALYLFLYDSKASSSVIGSLGGLVTGIFGTLQGRPVEGLGGVKIGERGGRLGGLARFQ